MHRITFQERVSARSNLETLPLKANHEENLDFGCGLSQFFPLLSFCKKIFFELSSISHYLKGLKFQKRFKFGEFLYQLSLGGCVVVKIWTINHQKVLYISSFCIFFQKVAKLFMSIGDLTRGLVCFLLYTRCTNFKRVRIIFRMG